RDQRHGEQPAERGRRAERPVEARADDDRHAGDVGARQEVTEAEEIDELALGQPAALLDDHAARPRQRAAEASRAGAEESAIELAERRTVRRPGRGHAAMIRYGPGGDGSCE